jgi:hypothetical protein
MFVCALFGRTNSMIGAAFKAFMLQTPHWCLGFIVRMLGNLPFGLPSIGLKMITEIALEETSPSNPSRHYSTADQNKSLYA